MKIKNIAVIVMLVFCFFSTSVIGANFVTIERPNPIPVQPKKICYRAYEFYTTGDNCAAWLETTIWHAQSFTVGTTGPDINFTVLNIRLFGCKTISEPGASIGPVIVSIREVLTGDELTIGCINGDTLSDTYSWFVVPVIPIELHKDTMYYLIVRAPEAPGAGIACVQLCKDATGEYLGGQNWDSNDSGQTWWDGYNPEGDFLFQVFGVGDC